MIFSSSACRQYHQTLVVNNIRLLLETIKHFILAMENEVKSILNEVELPKNVLLLLELYGLRTVKDLSKLNDDILKEVEANVRDGSFHADQLSFLDSTNLEKFHIKPFDLRKLQKAIEIAGRK